MKEYQKGYSDYVKGEKLSGFNTSEYLNGYTAAERITRCNFHNSDWYRHNGYKRVGQDWEGV